MKTHTIFRKVGGILAEINEQYEYLSESPENLNDLELELLSANADFLAEHIKVLKKLNFTGQVPSEAEIKNSSENLPKPVEVQESLHTDSEPQPAVDNLTKQEFPEPYSAFNNPVKNQLPEVNDVKEEVEDISTPVAEENSQPEVKLPEPELKHEVVEENTFFNAFFTPEAKQVNKSEPVENVELLAQEPIIHEVVIEEKVVNVEDPVKVEEPKSVPTLNEIMSAQRTQSSTFGQLNKPQQVSDLKSIINLNDKLLFIKDLFNGYSLAYSEAIEIINRFDSFDAADNFLKTNYSAKNNWASKQATADKFYQLLNRRFSV